ncbi:hypothetical protein UlMin_031141 [Ulmus minor]
MNVLASECSSGCESGWTLYLEQSFLSPNASHKGSGFVGKNGFCDEYKDKRTQEVDEEEEEEDLSMVSDASSGPPHFHEDEVYSNDDVKLSKTDGKKHKFKEQRRGKDQEQSCFLDDTASSPPFSFSNMEEFTMPNNQASMESSLDYSQGFSATHFQGRSAYQDPFGFLQSSLSGNQLQKMNGSRGRRWE